jgi:hypothetical protein
LHNQHINKFGKKNQQQKKQEYMQKTEMVATCNDNELVLHIFMVFPQNLSIC